MWNRRETKSDDLQPGATFGPYRLEELLGVGGMGQVFRAVHEGVRETVALKVMKSSLTGDEQYGRRFIREARSATAVRNKHLVEVLDAGHVDGRQYIAMRYVRGATLEQRIRDAGPLSLSELVDIVAQVAAGLDALHREGIVHRDVKTSNILLEDEAGAMLTDFGLAKGRGYSLLTRPGQVVGTLDYLPPELIRGERATPRSDVYSLGCVVYECVSGQPPFAHVKGGVMPVAMAHLEEQPPDPAAGRDDVPPAFSEMAARAIAKDPDERPPTAIAYANLLRAAAHLPRPV